MDQFIETFGLMVNHLFWASLKQTMIVDGFQ